MTHKLGQGRWRTVIGLTGGLGSGKSTVLSMFKKKGAFTLDADEIVHKTLKKKRIMLKIIQMFGSQVLKNGKKLDRKKVASIVFSSPAQRRRLEGILHPLVRKEMGNILAHRFGKVAICDVPLLFEKGWTKSFDRVLVVNASMPIRLKRLRKRKISLGDAHRRMKAQWPLSRKVKKADFVVQNNKTLSETKKQVHAIWQRILNTN